MLLQSSLRKFKVDKFVQYSRAFSKTLLGNYKIVPLDLFRIGRDEKVKLRDYEVQLKKGSRSYDYVLNKDGLIHPSPLDSFIGPNGMSLRPAEINMWDVLSSFRGKCLVAILKAGTKIPDDLILLHEYGDHYSLQTTVARTPKELNTSLTNFLSSCEFITKEEYFKRYPLN